ncbi:peptide-N4-asparagine amidase [Streptomyces sp. URMC 123]|uniref:peptide-N4-asparagine amidase n=1 Tax=Streptomyces sp. URMC 123 TaxID=3423403 RepID=UPI003F1AD20D
MRRQIMSMFVAGVVVAGSALGAAAPAAAGPGARTPAPASASNAPATPPAATAPATPSSPAAPAVPSSDEPPAEFGRDWHDPLTAAPPVKAPPTPSCSVRVAHAAFRDFTPYRGTYTPPEGCGSRWNTVVMRLDGAVAGRQYDRLGHVSIGGVEMLRTSTPQPSPEGITWSVEKDVTRYAPVLRSPRPVEMLIGNVVDETHTGVIEVTVTLTFYASDKGHPPAVTPDRVLTLDGARDEGGVHTGDLTTPRNSERIVAEVYATGSGGGCEEYWYLAVPDGAPYSCTAPDGPYREVQIRVDGRLAGIAAPFPTVWTGGWSNPFLWYVIPGPRAFDIKPIEYDLTPFAGLLNDGRPHRVEVSVRGVPRGQSGWSTPVNVLVWQDAGREQVTGALTRHQESRPENSAQHVPGAEHRLDSTGGHRLETAGHVNTSHGRVETSVERAVASSSVHRWTEDESLDALDARWTDRETVTVDGPGPATVTRTHRTYTMDGRTTLGAGDRLRTVLRLGDSADTAVMRASAPVSWTQFEDRYAGDATYTTKVPREERHAVGTSAQRYRQYGSRGCYDRELGTAQGALVTDLRRC